MSKPDAQQHHDRHSGPQLIAKAIESLGTQKALAARVGLSPESLRLIANGTYDLQYPLQFMLEVIINET